VFVALWKGAKAAGLARDTNVERKSAFGIKIAGQWMTLPYDIEKGLRHLAEDPAGFAVAARKALDYAHKNSPQDWLRPLRDLINRPTRRRFEALLKNGAQNGDSDLRIFFLVLRRAARRIFDGNLPMTWQNQIAADKKKMLITPTDPLRWGGSRRSLCAVGVRSWLRRGQAARGSSAIRSGDCSATRRRPDSAARAVDRMSAGYR
jgi:hypothetical protein